jgi:hypothetical protein
MKQLCAIPLLFVLVQTGFGQLSGALNGTLGPGEFHVIDTIYVNAGDSLALMPGTTFLFDGPYPFWIYGTLLAEGLDGDSIIFTTDTLANPDRWRGLRFSDSTSSGSRFAYCRIENALAIGYGTESYGGGIFCNTNSSPTFTHCEIRNNIADIRGGGVYCYNSSLTFRNCLITANRADRWCGGGVFCGGGSAHFMDCIISGNSAEDDGGGVECYDYAQPTFENCEITGNRSNVSGGGMCSAGSGPTLTNCTISANSANQGGGMGSHDSWLTLVDCRIHGNIADHDGGGLRFYDCYLSTFTNCTVAGNVAGGDGGGVYCAFSDPDFTRCTLSGNSAEQEGGGVFCYYAATTFNSSIVAYSHGAGVFFNDNSETSQFGHCDIFGNSGGNITFRDDDPSQGPEAIGVLDRTNAQGDSCDLYYNIFAEPFFVDTAANDFHLTEASPCIDAGDPDLPNDPDGTVADIGAFYYHQVDAGSPVALLPTAPILHPNWPNPFNGTTTLRYHMPQAGQVRVTIFNLLGQEVTRLADGHQLAGFHTISWEATNSPSGIYLCRMEAQGFAQTRKLVLLK